MQDRSIEVRELKQNIKNLQTTLSTQRENTITKIIEKPSGEKVTVIEKIKTVQIKVKNETKTQIQTKTKIIPKPDRYRFGAYAGYQFFSNTSYGAYARRNFNCFFTTCFIQLNYEQNQFNRNVSTIAGLEISF